MSKQEIIIELEKLYGFGGEHPEFPRLPWTYSLSYVFTPLPYWEYVADRILDNTATMVKNTVTENYMSTYSERMQCRLTRT